MEGKDESENILSPLSLPKRLKAEDKKMEGEAAPLADVSLARPSFSSQSSSFHFELILNHHSLPSTSTPLKTHLPSLLLVSIPPSRICRI